MSVTYRQVSMLVLGNLPVRDQSFFKLVFKVNVYNRKNILEELLELYWSVSIDYDHRQFSFKP